MYLQRAESKIELTSIRAPTKSLASRVNLLKVLSSSGDSALCPFFQVTLQSPNKSRSSQPRNLTAFLQARSIVSMFDDDESVLRSTRVSGGLVCGSTASGEASPVKKTAAASQTVR